jgi:hypothetical protein
MTAIRVYVSDSRASAGRTDEFYPVELNSSVALIYQELCLDKSYIFWNITPCSPLYVIRFVPVDGSDMFHRNVGWITTDYTALYSRR